MPFFSTRGGASDNQGSRLVSTTLAKGRAVTTGYKKELAPPPISKVTRGMNYQQSGVDIEVGNSLVEWLKDKEPQQGPHQERQVSALGGFSALFRGSFPEMDSPCLVSATDGVGTKVLLASQFQQYEGIGQDLVAMCVNDLICCGAQPLFFLDYYATGRLDLTSAKAFLQGVQRSCLDSDCALIGGETAEMPGLYREREFDCAGFALGVVDEKSILGSLLVKEGDLLMGFASSGFHSNGFSLLRKVLADKLRDKVEGELWKNKLMTPTKLYAKAIQQILKTKEGSEGLHAFAHITGGGVDNICRVIPSHTKVQLKEWDIPQDFLDIEEMAGLSRHSLLQTFNCGIGMVAILGSQYWESIFNQAHDLGLEPINIGSIKVSDKEQATWELSDQPPPPPQKPKLKSKESGFNGS